MKTLIIAEKPSVATDLARALGKLKKEKEHYENEELVITSAVGHLVELFMPEDIDKGLKRWTLSTLPIIPDKFKLKPIERTKKKLQDIKRLLKRDDIECVVNACDAGREGELIFAYIYELAKCKKPVKRMWMMSMTQEGIQQAYREMRGADEMLPLQAAARCRSESDWLLGINGTRAVTSRMFGARGRQAATVGRVQTPTLALIFGREQVIRQFKPRTYWRLEAQFGIQEGEYLGVYQKPEFKKGDDEHDRVDRLWEKSSGEKILAEIEASEDQVIVTETKKRSKQQSPRLYDLTSLQREANSRFGLAAGHSLRIAQALYEKHKMITYPRTDSRALPEDYLPVCRDVLNGLDDKYSKYGKKLLDQGWLVPSKRIFDNKKVSDHFAIIPTDAAPKKLSEDEVKIYDMIVRRFIAVFYPPAEYDVTIRISEICKYIFKTEGKVLTVSGWLEVYGKEQASSGTLPALVAEDGDPPKATINTLDLLEDQTKPPPRYSEATLLAAMEGAGKFVEDEELADAMKERGLGTPATRAQIIDHLIREKYVERQQRELVPTMKAENLIEFLQALGIESLTSPAMTGEWEYKLSQIQEGQLTRDEFMLGIADMTKHLVQSALDYDESKNNPQSTDIISPTDNKPMFETARTYRSQDEDLIVYKITGNRRLAKEEVETLVRDRKIGPLDDFRSKAGKPFSAMLEINDENKVRFVFDTSSNDGLDEDGKPMDFTQYEAIGECPLCKAKGLDSKIREAPNAYICQNINTEGDQKCSLRVSRTLLSRSIPQEQMQKLITVGKTDLLEQFKSKRTNRFFSAHLTLDGKGKIGFEFAAKKKATTKKTVRKATKKKA